MAKLCSAYPFSPSVTRIVTLCSPTSTSVGVPARIAVPSPLSVRVSHGGWLSAVIVRTSAVAVGHAHLPCRCWGARNYRYLVVGGHAHGHRSLLGDNSKMNAKMPCFFDRTRWISGRESYSKWRGRMAFFAKIVDRTGV